MLQDEFVGLKASGAASARRGPFFYKTRRTHGSTLAKNDIPSAPQVHPVSFFMVRYNPKRRSHLPTRLRKGRVPGSGGCSRFTQKLLPP